MNIIKEINKAKYSRSKIKIDKDITLFKPCTKCYVLKSMYDYIYHKRDKDYFGPCRECNKLKSKNFHNKANNEKLSKLNKNYCVINIDTTIAIGKFCYKCKGFTLFRSLVKDRNCSHGVKDICLLCNREIGRDRYAKNKEHIRKQQNDRYDALHPNKQIRGKVPMPREEYLRRRRIEQRQVRGVTHLPANGDRAPKKIKMDIEAVKLSRKKASVKFYSSPKGIDVRKVEADKYKNNEEYREDIKNKAKIRREYNRDNLTDIHVKKILTSKGKLSTSDIPQALVDLKRAQMLLSREDASIEKVENTASDIRKVCRECGESTLLNDLITSTSMSHGRAKICKKCSTAIVRPHIHLKQILKIEKYKEILKCA